MLFVALLSVDAIYAQQVANYNRSRLPTHASRFRMLRIQNFIERLMIRLKLWQIIMVPTLDGNQGGFVWYQLLQPHSLLIRYQKVLVSMDNVHRTIDLLDIHIRRDLVPQYPSQRQPPAEAVDLVLETVIR